MNDIREMCRAAPTLMVSVGAMLAVSVVVGLTAVLFH
jgi:hypothetical protein